MSVQNAQSATVRLTGGVYIPQLGLGVWQTPRGEVTREAVRTALRVGYRHIDTASAYGNEADVGAAVRESGLTRSQVFVTSKLWNDDQGYDATLRAFDASLKRTGLEYLDLYLLHWPVAGKRRESWRALEKLHAEGRVHAIGVSNFLLPHLRELLEHAKVAPTINQLELTPFLQRRDTVEFCRAHQILLEAYSPLTRGERLSDARLVAIAERVERSPAQVLLRWGLQHGFVVLPKSTRAERIEENARIFDFTLDEAAMTLLDGMEENLVTGWDPARQR
ncbi:MAG: aldo/keto reductase [Polyangiales bacterium]